MYGSVKVTKIGPGFKYLSSQTEEKPRGQIYC